MKALLFAKKVILFIYRYATADPKYLLIYCTTFFLPGYRNKVIFYSDRDAISLLKEGRTLIRIGDGEAGLLHGGHVSYQKHDKSLAKSIKNIVSSYESREDFLLAIPHFVNFSNNELKNTKGGVRCWLPLKIEFRRSFSKKKAYVDAHLFYRKENVRELLEYLRTRTLFIVTTKKNIEKIKEASIFSSSTLFFVAPEPNPFTGYSEIMEQIQKSLPYDNSPVTLLLSAGPLSKVLAYDFLSRGLQSIDIGLGIEVLHTKTGYEKTI